jgi:hypothetical protein
LVSKVTSHAVAVMVRREIRGQETKMSIKRS